MARTGLPVGKLVGILLLVIGAGLVYWAYQLSDSIASQLTETFSGSMPEEVMIRYIAGAAGVAAGAYLLLRK